MIHAGHDTMMDPDDPRLAQHERLGNYAPGSYWNRCHDCQEMFIGDKRAWQCHPCAVIADAKWSPVIYGTAPIDHGLIDLQPTEMMFWQYCPIKVPGMTGWCLPANLFQFQPIVTRVADSIKPFDDWHDSYAYITAKTLYVTDTHIGNRPGWHSDGFGTDDLNFVWYDRAPTDFLISKYGLRLPRDCAESMAHMDAMATLNVYYGTAIETFPDKHLLRLDQRVIHRSPVEFAPGMRTFVKVSISKERYNLEGNAKNHELPESHWPLVPRQPERNHPVAPRVTGQKLGAE